MAIKTLQEKTEGRGRVLQKVQPGERVEFSYLRVYLGFSDPIGRTMANSDLRLARILKSPFASQLVKPLEREKEIVIQGASYTRTLAIANPRASQRNDLLVDRSITHNFRILMGVKVNFYRNFTDIA